MGCGASTEKAKYAAADGAPPMKAAPSQEGNSAPSGRNPSLREPSSVDGGSSFDGFISHCKADAAMEARFLQTELQRLMGDGSRLFLDSDDLRDLSKLRNHVRSSKCLVLCQSEAVLRRPYCLIELATAVDAGIPIVGVALGKKYDFGAAARFLSHLDTLLEAENPGAPKMLAENGITDLVALSHKLSSTIPNIISIELNPSASRNVLNASLADVRDAMASATPTSLPEFDPWLAARGAPDAAATDDAAAAKRPKSAATG